MDDNDDIRQLSDPDFLAERTRVREELQELTERFQQLNEEFDRRARAAWTSASTETAKPLTVEKAGTATENVPPSPVSIS